VLVNMELSSEPATADNIAPARDIEKSTETRLEQEERVVPVPQIPAIDPVIEKRVVRKLDRRVPVVTAFLCKFVSAGASRQLEGTCLLRRTQICWLFLIAAISGTSFPLVRTQSISI
jgi:hypothetical protein